MVPSFGCPRHLRLVPKGWSFQLHVGGFAAPVVFDVVVDRVLLRDGGEEEQGKGVGKDANRAQGWPGELTWAG